ncbi:uncharacterized protein LOC142489160 isoform X2 [Ascaphus truei]|uniref:uncharacterized protein LOC142489160 isoform X2 n=1 Tax=Ascaphus truei TaxID=8439 RepID=UPI003F59D0FE
MDMAPLSRLKVHVRRNLAPVIVHPAFPYCHRMDMAPLSRLKVHVRRNLAPVIVHPAFPYCHRMDIIRLPFSSIAASKCPSFVPSRPPVSSYLFPVDGCAKETMLGVLRHNARIQKRACGENPSSGAGDRKKSEEELKEPSTSIPAVTQGETSPAEHGSAPDNAMEHKSSGSSCELYNKLWLIVAWCGEQLLRLLAPAAGQRMAEQQVGTLQGPVKSSSPSGLETTMGDGSSDCQDSNSNSTRSPCFLGTCTHGIRQGPHNSVSSSYSSSACFSQFARRIVTLNLGSRICSSLCKPPARGTQQPSGGRPKGGSKKDILNTRDQMLFPHRGEEHKGGAKNKGIVKPRDQMLFPHRGEEHKGDEENKGIVKPRDQMLFSHRGEEHKGDEENKGIVKPSGGRLKGGSKKDILNTRDQMLFPHRGEEHKGDEKNKGILKPRDQMLFPHRGEEHKGDEENKGIVKPRDQMLFSHRGEEHKGDEENKGIVKPRDQMLFPHRGEEHKGDEKNKGILKPRDQMLFPHRGEEHKGDEKNRSIVKPRSHKKRDVSVPPVTREGSFQNMLDSSKRKYPGEIKRTHKKMDATTLSVPRSHEGIDVSVPPVTREGSFQNMLDSSKRKYPGEIKRTQKKMDATTLSVPRDGSFQNMLDSSKRKYPGEIKRTHKKMDATTLSVPRSHEKMDVSVPPVTREGSFQNVLFSRKRKCQWEIKRL